MMKRRSEDPRVIAAPLFGRHVTQGRVCCREERLMHTAELIGYAAAIVTIATFMMKTMIPLRVCGIAANFLFIAYGYLDAAYPPLVLHLILLPLNVARL